MKIQLKLKYLTAALMFTSAMQTGFAMEDEQLRKSYNSLSQKEKNKINVEDYIKARKPEQVSNMHVDLKAEERVKANKFIDEALEKLRDAYKDPIFAEEFAKKKDLFGKTLKLEVAQNVEVQDLETARKLQEKIQELAQVQHELEQEKLKGGSGGLKADFFDDLFKQTQLQIEELEDERDAFKSQLKALGENPVKREEHDRLLKAAQDEVDRLDGLHKAAEQKLTDLGENPMKKEEHDRLLKVAQDEVDRLDGLHKAAEQKLIDLGENPVKKAEHDRLMQEKELAHQNKIIELSDPDYKAKLLINNNLPTLEQAIDEAKQKLALSSPKGREYKVLEGASINAAQAVIAFLKDDELVVVLGLAKLAVKADGSEKENRLANRTTLLKYATDNGIAIDQTIKKGDANASITKLVKEVAEFNDKETLAYGQAKLVSKQEISAAAKAFVAKLDKSARKLFIEGTIKGDVSSDDNDTFAGIIEAHVLSL